MDERNSNTLPTRAQAGFLSPKSLLPLCWRALAARSAGRARQLRCWWALLALCGTALEAAEVNLRWKDNANDESGFRIERSTDGKSYGRIATLQANVTQFKDSTASAGKRYWYRVAAYNANGQSGYTNIVSTTLPTPATAAEPSPSSPTKIPALAISGFDKSHKVGARDSFTVAVNNLPDSSIKKVELREGGRTLMAKKVAPYKFNYTPKSTGSKKLTVVATLTSGTIKKSLSTKVSAAPKASVPTAPKMTVKGFDGTYKVGDQDVLTLSVSGISASSIHSVELREDGQTLTARKSGPYTFKYVPVSDGTKKLVFILKTRSGTFKKTLTATVVSPPSPQISVSGFAGSYEVGDLDQFSVSIANLSAAAIAKVDLYEDGTRIASRKSGPYAFDYIPVSGGRKQLTVVATTLGGQTLQKTLVAEVSSSSSPLVKVSGYKGSYRVGEKDGFTVTVGDTPADAILSITLFEDGNPIMRASAAPYAFSYTAKEAGRRQLTLIVTTRSGTLYKHLTAAVSE